MEMAPGGDHCLAYLELKAIHFMEKPNYCYFKYSSLLLFIYALKTV